MRVKLLVFAIKAFTAATAHLAVLLVNTKVCTRTSHALTVLRVGICFWQQVRLPNVLQIMEINHFHLAVTTLTQMETNIPIHLTGLTLKGTVTIVWHVLQDDMVQMLGELGMG